jgi:hypothetical protein
VCDAAATWLLNSCLMCCLPAYLCPCQLCCMLHILPATPAAGSARRLIGACTSASAAPPDPLEPSFCPVYSNKKPSQSRSHAAPPAQLRWPATGLLAGRRPSAGFNTKFYPVCSFPALLQHIMLPGFFCCEKHVKTAVGHHTAAPCLSACRPLCGGLGWPPAEVAQGPTSLHS